MKHCRRLGAALLCTSIAAVMWAPPVAAQTIEVAGGSGLAQGTGGGTLDSSYEPPFPFVEHSGTAMQRLSIERDKALLLWASVSWFASAHVGLEGRVDYRRSGLHGANGPYAVRLRYVARQPPDFIAREYTYDSAVDWPDTSGHVGQLTASGAAVVRLGRPTGTTVRLLAGAGVTRLAGRVDPVGYTTFSLGGHSVLFPDEHRLSLRVEPASTIGLSIGADLQVPMGGHAAFVAGWRLFVPRRMELTVIADGLADSDTGINVLEWSDVQQTLHPPPIQWRPVTSDLTLGLAVRF